MKLKLISLGIMAAGLLANCGGNKNETQVDDSMILAVRSLEDTSVVDASERTQVALLSGDISTPEKAQIAAENAQWMPISQFSQDEELSFSPVQTQNVDASIESIAGMRDGERNGNNGRRNDNDRDQGRRRHDNNNDRNWRPYTRHQQNWNRPYTPRPPAPYYGYSQCNNSYIYYSGQCVRPYSPYYGNYFWQPRYYYYTNVVYRGYRHNRYNWRGRAHIRFYW